MTELTKIAGSPQQNSSFGFSEWIAVAAIVVLLLSLQGKFIIKNATTLNIAAASAVFGIIAP